MIGPISTSSVIPSMLVWGWSSTRPSPTPPHCLYDEGTANLQRHHFFLLLSTAASRFKVRRCATQAVQRACSPHYYLVVLLLSHHPVLAVLGYGPLSDRGCHHSNGNDNYMLRDGGNLKKYDKTIPRASAFLFMIRL